MTGESFTNARCRPERASSRRTTTSPLSSTPEPGLVQHRPRRGHTVQREHGLHGGGLGIGPDDVGLGPGPAHEEDRVDQDGLARAGLTREHVQAGSERGGDGFHDGEILDPYLAQHQLMLGHTPRGLKKYPIRVTGV